MYKDYNMT